MSILVCPLEFLLSMFFNTLQNVFFSVILIKMDASSFKDITLLSNLLKPEQEDSGDDEMVTIITFN